MLCARRYRGGTIQAQLARTRMQPAMIAMCKRGLLIQTLQRWSIAHNFCMGLVLSQTGQGTGPGVSQIGQVDPDSPC